MNQADALDIVQSALWTVIVASGPAVGAAMAVGIVIALLQALTQVQEITLTFIPKIIAILLVASISAPFIGTVIYTFAEQIYARIEIGFRGQPDGDRGQRLSLLISIHQKPFVVVVRSDPEPSDRVAFQQSHCTVVNANANGVKWVVSTHSLKRRPGWDASDLNCSYALRACSWT